jgi:undecaprenyl-diphosphatase
MLEKFDQQLFLFLNSFHSHFWDQVMFAISSIPIWFPLYIAILVYLALTYRKKFYIILIFIVLAVTLSDQFSVIIKNIVMRPRPCYEHALEGLVHIVNGKCGGKFGFVSSHAANSFSVALFSLLMIRKRWFTVSIVIWACIVSYSRIYLGVHYTGDVFCGAILGIIAGWSSYRFYVLAEDKLLKRKGVINSRGRQ